MIRAAALLCLMALPAQAQDFRGLLPGDPASRLGAIGEAMSLNETDDGLRQAAYPLPFGHVLQVRYDTGSGTIERIVSWGPFESNAPQLGGFQVHETTLKDVLDQVEDPESIPLDVIEYHLPSQTLRLYFDVAELPDALLAMVFFWPNQAVDIASAQATANTGEPTLPNDAIFGQVELLDRAYMARLPDVYPPRVLDRTDPFPFPLTIDEAFPSLIPQ